jgi:hypothetical protein
MVNLLMLMVATYLLHRSVMFVSDSGSVKRIPFGRRIFATVGIGGVVWGAYHIAFFNYADGGPALLIGVAALFLSDSRACLGFRPARQPDEVVE